MQKKPKSIHSNVKLQSSFRTPQMPLAFPQQVSHPLAVSEYVLPKIKQLNHILVFTELSKHHNLIFLKTWNTHWQMVPQVKTFVPLIPNNDSVSRSIIFVPETGKQKYTHFFTECIIISKSPVCSNFAFYHSVKRSATFWTISLQIFPCNVSSTKFSKSKSSWNSNNFFPKSGPKCVFVHGENANIPLFSFWWIPMVPHDIHLLILHIPHFLDPFRFILVHYSISPMFD